MGCGKNIRSDDISGCGVVLHTAFLPLLCRSYDIYQVIGVNLKPLRGVQSTRLTPITW